MRGTPSLHLRGWARVWSVKTRFPKHFFFGGTAFHQIFIHSSKYTISRQRRRPTTWRDIIYNVVFSKDTSTRTTRKFCLFEQGREKYDMENGGMYYIYDLLKTRRLFLHVCICCFYIKKWSNVFLMYIFLVYFNPSSCIDSHGYFYLSVIVVIELFFFKISIFVLIYVVITLFALNFPLKDLQPIRGLWNLIPRSLVI